MAAVEKGKLGL